MELYATSTGENTIYLPELDETYHSRHGAISESIHVFVNEGIHRRLALSPISHLDILEIGFGTGLNALLTYKESGTFSYVSLEPFPIPEDIVTRLKYGQLLDSQDMFLRIHACEWGKKVQINENFTIEKIEHKLENFEPDKTSYDVIFFDAFAPQKQPELWTVDVFKKMYESLRPNGILTTYSAAGKVKRALKSVGFTIENPPGANGKREMTVGIKKNE